MPRRYFLGHRNSGAVWHAWFPLLACLLAFALTPLASAQSGTPDYTLSITPSNTIIYTGGKALFNITATPLNGFDQTLVLSCSPLPSDARCVFAPDGIVANPPPGSEFYTPYASQLTITTAAPTPQTSAAGLKQAGWTGGIATLAGICGWLLVPSRIRKKYLRALEMRSVLMSGLLLGLFTALSGCGGGGTLTGGTPPGTYMVTVTAKLYESSASLTHSQTVTLVVKSLF